MKLENPHNPYAHVPPGHQRLLPCTCPEAVQHTPVEYHESHCPRFMQWRREVDQSRPGPPA